MKKNYESPKLEVYELKWAPKLLEGSPEGQGTGGDQNIPGL